jgi:hypothetical protein
MTEDGFEIIDHAKSECRCILLEDGESHEFTQGIPYFQLKHNMFTAQCLTRLVEGHHHSTTRRQLELLEHDNNLLREMLTSLDLRVRRLEQSSTQGSDHGRTVPLTQRGTTSLRISFRWSGGGQCVVLAVPSRRQTIRGLKSELSCMLDIPAHQITVFKRELPGLSDDTWTELEDFGSVEELGKRGLVASSRAYSRWSLACL